MIPSPHWQGILEATYVQSLDAAQDTNYIHLSHTVIISHSITSIYTSDYFKPFSHQGNQNQKRQKKKLSKKGKKKGRDMCTPMLITALFIIARTWKQPKCPSADEWIRKLWYIYTMEYNSAIKKNTFESVLMRWMKLDFHLQSEISQKEKHQYSILTHIYGI